MLFTHFTVPAMLVSLVAASSLPLEYLSSASNSLEVRDKPCKHGPKSRHCWGDYSLKTNYYQDIPNTGVTREYWFDVQNTTLAPDGYLQNVLTINGSIPGPTIIADWGDEVIIHVTNNMQFNGTTIHWHGIRQHNNNENDGVPGVTQCPIAPGQSYTYRWRAEQYGSSWYHSHFSFQYSAGLYGGIIINGPATADYDEDLGNLFLSDWGHIDPFNQWWWNRPKTGPPSQANSLINGTNVFDCTGSKNPNCFGNGTRFEMVFDHGKKYRLRLVNPSLYGHYRFAIDGHTLTVIANDFVPIVPYKTDNVIISMGQRYDIIVEANAKPDNYWLRPIWQRSCCDNDYWNNTLGIVRYNKHSKDLPKTTNAALSYPDTCDDEPFDKLVPYMKLDVPAPAYIPPLNLYFAFVPMPAGFLFTLNQSYIWVNFSAPTNLLLSEGVHNFPSTPYPNATGGGFTDYDAFELEGRDKWVYYAVQDISHRNRSHPFHLHGHDYYVLAQGSGNYTGQPLNLKNPIRRDTATVPMNGYMVMAFKLDNPGSWLFHCHIAAHSSEGLGLQFVELEDEITGTFKAQDQLDETCNAWGGYWKDSIFIQEDSGI